MLNHEERLDLVFRALGDRTRRALVERLVRGPASVSELAAPLTMSLAAVVQHLQVLETAGIVRSEKVGRVRTCRITPEALRAGEAWLGQRRTSWESRLDRLGDVLAESGPSEGSTS
ncbi:metalloregulator ArsR/SmtB family transcription factor [Streptomyces sp. SL13]|jgi:DNA-binding transcriptional ArsR family regulator|uniref:Metalloregulator ArsR/SmtB family transcription factor n=1 Tax=Streptantibioticus silvisoli TaxID=2705255 RepID=A0AA90GXI6_9ACTN|nr:metalloregulator ArsR/SmtB family transcription factor [Streptantibioticus silvisoli]MDI5965520.1 metalloregulator ArsR/SmtB family transcription factor [Streptantibioticus silvisoli]MDI5969963.1 metalloregulator ArsR/SmtB family transcription factor [Streptantibioticus silvisoli]